MWETQTDMGLYTLRRDEAFQQAFNETVMRVLALEQLKRMA